MSVLYKVNDNNSGFIYNGGYKSQLMLILQDDINKRTDFWFNNIWNNYEHFIS